jgi:hypothetical protein
MAKKISSSDLFEQEDLFKGVRDSATKTLDVFNKLQAELKQTAQGLKTELNANTQTSTAQLKQFSAATEQANKMMKQAVEIEKLKAQADQQKIKAEQELVKLEKLKAQEQARANKEAEKSAKAAKDQNNAYKQLEKSTRDLKNQSKELGAQMLKLEQSGKKNGAEYQKLASKYKLVTQAAQQGDAQLKKLDKTVGDNFRNVGNYQNAIGGLKNMLGQLGLAFGIGSVIRDSFNVVKDFDQGVANLASVLGTTREQVVALENDAKRLGATTAFTAGEVAQLQTEYAKLGFTEKEILSATEATLNLAAATGSELGRAAEVAGSTVRAFGLTADETMRVTDVMAKSFSTSALDMEKFAEAMKNVAPVSKAAGLSVEETTAMLGALANAGISGSAAGTALRQVISEMDKTGKSTGEALKDLAEKGLSLADAEDEVGRNAKTALLVLADQTKTVDNLTKQYENAKGSSKAMADTQLNTVGGALKLLSSAWEGLILKMNDASGAGQIFVNIIKFVANNLGTIVSLVLKTTAAWLTYKAGIMAVNAANFLMNGGFQQITKSLAAMIPGTRAARLEQLQLARAQQQVGTTATGAGTAVKGFGQAFKSIAWVALIATLAELAVAWYDIASGAAEARRQQDMFNRSKENADKKARESQEKTQGVIDESIRKLDLELRTRKANGESEAKLEAERAQRTKKIITDAKSEYDAKTKTALADANALWHRKKFLEEEEARPWYLRKRDYEKTKKELDEVTEQYNTVTLTYNNLAKGQKSFNDQLEEAAVKTIETSEATGDYSVKVADNTHHIKTNTKALQENVDLTREIQDEQVKAIQDEGRRAQTELILQAKRRIEDIEKTVADKNQKATLIKQIEANLIAALDKMDQEWYEKSLEAQKQADANKLKAKNEFLDEIERITEENTRRMMSEQEVEERDVNDKYFALEEAAKDDAEALAQIQIAKMNELNDIRLKYQNIEYDNKKEADQKLLDADKKKNEEMWQTTQDFAQKTTDYFKKKSDERIAQIEKEISAAEKQADYYRELAANGNINAQQSLAEQERIIAESNRRKEREQKRAQRMELANTIYQTYAGHAAKDPDTALMKTIKDASLLQAFISTLPMFYDGTEDTGSGGGVDGKGGFHAVLHPHERVIPKSLNDQIGNLTNEQLTRLAMEYNNGRLVGQDVAHSSLDLAILVNEMQDLKEIIRSKPETNIELGEITQSAMEIVKSTRKGNTTVYNRFKVRT